MTAALIFSMWRLLCLKVEQGRGCGKSTAPFLAALSRRSRSRARTADHHAVRGDWSARDAVSDLPRRTVEARTLRPRQCVCALARLSGGPGRGLSGRLVYRARTLPAGMAFERMAAAVT